MMLGNPIYILAASTVGYMIFNTLNLIAGYLLRKDARPPSGLTGRR